MREALWLRVEWEKGQILFSAELDSYKLRCM